MRDSWGRFYFYIEATGWLNRMYEATNKLPEVEIVVVVVVDCCCICYRCSVVLPKLLYQQLAYKTLA